MLPVVAHLYPEPPQPQMVRLQILPAHQALTGEDRWVHLPNSPQKQKKKSKNQDKQKNGYSQQPQAQQADTGAHTAPPQVNRNTQPPPPGQNWYFYPPRPGGYMYPPPPSLPQQHIPQPSQIIIQQDPDTAAAL